MIYYTDIKKLLLPSTVHVIMTPSIQHLVLNIMYKNVVDKLRLALYRIAQTIAAFFNTRCSVLLIHNIDILITGFRQN